MLPRALVVFLCGSALALPACDDQAPSREQAASAARRFIVAFASGDYAAAAAQATGEVLYGVEVQRATRERERREHPAEIAMLEKAVRERPPEVRMRTPRDYRDHVEVRAEVTTIGPHGPEVTAYDVLLAMDGRKWKVYRWQKR